MLIPVVAAYFSYFFICAIAVLIAYVIGFYVQAFIQLKIENSYLGKSVRLFLGLLLLISIFALLQSRLESIFIIVFISLLFYLPQFKIREIQFPRLRIDLDHWDLLMLLILFALNSVYFIPHSFNLYPGYFGDHLFYADVADSLLLYHSENIFRSSNLFLPSIYSPYHYFDIWFNSLLAFFSKKPSVVLYISAVGSIFQLMTAWSILAFFKRRRVLLICFVIAFFASNFKSILPLDLLASHVPILQFYAKYHSFALLIKLLPTLVVFLYLCFIFTQKRELSYVPFLCVLLLMINIANVFLAAFILLFYMLFYFEKNKKNILALSAALLAFVFVPLFYFVISDKYELSTFFSLEKLNFSSIMYAIKTAVGILFSFLVFYSPYLLFIALFAYSKCKCKAIDWKNLIAFCCLFLTLLFLGTLIGIFQKDGIQFFTNTAWVITGILLFIVLMKGILYFLQLIASKKLRLAIEIILLLLLFGIFFNKIQNNEKRSAFYGEEQLEQNYLKEIKGIFEKDSSELIRVGSFFKKADYTESHKIFYSFNPLGSYLKLLSPKVEVWNLSSYEVYLEGPNAYTRKTAKLDPATIFVKMNTEVEPGFEASVASIHELIAEQNIQYLLLSDTTILKKYRIEDFLKKYHYEIAHSIKNNKFGESFIVLKKVP